MKIVGKGVRLILLAVFSATSLVACSDDSSNTDPANPAEDDMNNPMGRVQATVLQWQDQIQLTYTFTNTSDADIIAFDNGYAGANDVTQAVKIDDAVRLFKGKIDTGSLTFVTQPTIGGRLVMPDETLEGSATIDFPIQVPSETAEGGSELVSVDEASFCIGFSVASEVIDTMIGNGDYPLNEGLDLQQFACVAIARP